MTFSIFWSILTIKEEQLGSKKHRNKASSGRTELNRALAGAASVHSKTNGELTLQKLMVMTPPELEGIDIAEMNLLCATGLPGAENLNIPSSLVTLNRWAQWVGSETQRHFYQYQAHPEKFNYLEGYFRMMMLISVLFQDFKVHYSTTRSNDEPADTFFANSNDIFLNGLIGEKREGTCGSIPVLVVAVARRLGYPVKLVSARAHAFVRWEDGKDRFNIECTNGVKLRTDEHYLTWPRPITPEMIEAEGYLKSMSATEELACFLSTRICCLDVNGRIEEAKKVSLRGVELMPSSKLLRNYSSQSICAT